ncbi:fatty acid desaturase [Nakamurella sp. UYEF19]|uniref:hypothetical protein n=1 Tax=Nakamurella sp. UYEF19 TaxID=1756392 RepID=UPI0033917E74
MNRETMMNAPHERPTEFRRARIDSPARTRAPAVVLRWLFRIALLAAAAYVAFVVGVVLLIVVVFLLVVFIGRRAVRSSRW